MNAQMSFRQLQILGSQVDADGVQMGPRAGFFWILPRRSKFVGNPRGQSTSLSLRAEVMLGKDRFIPATVPQRLLLDFGGPVVFPLSQNPEDSSGELRSSADSNLPPSVDGNFECH